MRLRELLEYDDIVIQCHDNPDADALASAFGVYRYLAHYGKQADIIYGGANASLKSSLKLMAETLEIPVHHVKELKTPELLITVDCQYGSGNVTHFPAEQVAVIDHHLIATTLPKLNEVCSSLGSCSTLVWQMLKEEGLDVNADQNLATALYYGLYIDTNALSEITHPLDKDLRDEAAFSHELMNRYRNCNLTMEEMETAGMALLQSSYHEEYRFAVLRAGDCDSNVLGVISDLVLEVDAIDICLVFSVRKEGIKFSIRSCIKEARANELADELSRGMGTGGGHIGKAGGFIEMESLCRHYEEYCEEQGLYPRTQTSEEGGREIPSPSAIQSFLFRQMEQYFEHCKVIYADSCQLEGEEEELYERLPKALGYVWGESLFPVGTGATIRTMEGDIDIRIEKDIVLLIGVQGEIYIRNAQTFSKDYISFERPYVLNCEEYAPTIRSNSRGEVISLLDYAKICFPSGRHIARAKELQCNARIFYDSSDTYTLGKPGDYLVARWDETPGVFLLSNSVFKELYQKV